MTISKKLVWTLLTGVGALLPPEAVAGTGNLVANPESSVYADWSPKKLSGKDYWIALAASWHNLKGVSHEKFVKESCLWGISPKIQTRNALPLRTGIIREIELLDAKGRNQAIKAKFHFSSPEEGVLFLYPGNLNNLKKYDFSVVSADIRNLKMRYRSVRGTFSVTCDPAVKIGGIRIYHGNRGMGELKTIELHDRSGKKIGLKTFRALKDSFYAKFKEEIPAEQLRIGIVTKTYQITLGDFPPAIAEKLQHMPFTVPDFLRIDLGNLMGLREENIDRKSFQHFTEKYKNTFLGFGISEFDSNYGQMRRPNNIRFENIKGYAPRKDQNREEAVKYMRNLWNYHLDVFGKPVFALSGGIMGSPYMAEWGANAVILEDANIATRSTRILMMSVKGAGKQYRIPWGHYVAYYALAANPHSWRRSPDGQYGLDYGLAPSQGMREILMNYYIGGNLQWFESQPWGQVKRNDDGTHELTGNGKAIKTVYDFVSRPEGKRGICYSPVLLLLDYMHGQNGRNSWKVWYHLPMKDGDYMAQHIFDTIAPMSLHARYGDPKHCNNIANSELGDIFDMFFANPPSGEITPEELGKFAVVILSDDIRFTPRLIANLKGYVKCGGTLVLNSAHLKKFGADKSFLGFDFRERYVMRDDMKIAEVGLVSAKSVISAKDGLPLVTQNRYGKGSVLCTTPYFMLKNSNKKLRSPLIRDLLVKIQSEVLPVRVKGDVQFILNKMDGNNWKLILVNNRGVAKEPYSSVEKFCAEYDSSVTVTVPEGASVREVYAGDSLKQNGRKYTLKVPAGSFRVLNLGNVKFGTPLINGKPFARKPEIKPWQDLCPTVKPVDSPVTDKKMIAEWTFDEGAGNTVKDSVSGRTIKLYNNPQFVKISSGHALKFDGKKSYGYGTLPFRSDKDRELSMEVWVKPDISAGSAWTMRKGRRNGYVVNHNHYAFELGISGDEWEYIVSRNGLCIDRSIKVKNGEWTQLVFAWKGFTAHFYVNGKEAISSFGTFKSSTIGGGSRGFLPIYLGTHYYQPGSGRSRVFNGLIGELRYFNYALTPEEIKKRLEAGRIKYSR